MARDLTRVTVNLSSDLVTKIDQYADENGIKRTSAVSVLLSQALQGQQAMSDLNKLIQLYESEKAKPKRD